MSQNQKNQEQKVGLDKRLMYFRLTFTLCRFHRIQRKRREKLGNRPEVTDEELTKLRVEVTGLVM